MYYPLVPVFISYDEEYAKEVFASLASLINHTDSNRSYRIHVLYSSMSMDNRKKFLSMSKSNISIRCNDISSLISKVKGKLIKNIEFSSTLIHPMIIADEFPLYNKAVYIPLHTMVELDVAPLFDNRLKNHLLGVIKCHHIDSQNKEYISKILHLNPHHYFYSDILLFNTKKWRQQKMLDRFIDITHFYSLPKACDQDYFNFLAKEDVVVLSRKYQLASDITNPEISYVYYRKDKTIQERIKKPRQPKDPVFNYVLQTTNLG